MYLYESMNQTIYGSLTCLQSPNIWQDWHLVFHKLLRRHLDLVYAVCSLHYQQWHQTNYGFQPTPALETIIGNSKYTSVVLWYHTPNRGTKYRKFLVEVKVQISPCTGCLVSSIILDGFEGFLAKFFDVFASNGGIVRPFALPLSPFSSRNLVKLVQLNDN